MKTPFAPPGAFLRKQGQACAHGEKGQSLAEFAIVAAFALVPLFLFSIYVGKWSFTQLRGIEAARYVAWERTVWRAAPPPGRDWPAIKGDDTLRQEVAMRFFGGRDERLEPVTAVQSASTGPSPEPLIHRHDGQPLVPERERITVTTSIEKDASALGKAIQGLQNIGAFPLEMSGPVVATVSVPVSGIPQFPELSRPLDFRAQAAVLGDGWSANGPGEEKKIVRSMAPQLGLLDNPVIRGAASLLSWVFPEYQRFEPSKVDPEVQYGDRLQPFPRH